jgi:glyoxylase-like metal-dependent hydrolase (beta-lactamase superfamily II)
MNVHLLDLGFRNLPHVVAAYLVESDGDLALVETGPASCLERLDAAIRGVGHAPESISRVIVTHVHLDHAGAAGHWAARGAKVLVHERGARHLVDPARLLDGARSVYGDALETLWGPVLPVPEGEVVALREGDEVRVGSAVFEVWDVPGHARHHLALVGGGGAFVGDVAGVRLPGCRHVAPATAPSQFEPEALRAALRRLREASLDRLYLTHFGSVAGDDAVADHLERYETVIGGVTALVGAHLGNGASPAEVADAFTRFNLDRARRDGIRHDRWLRYEAANDSAMSADGVRMWWEQQGRPGEVPGDGGRK